MRYMYAVLVAALVMCGCAEARPNLPISLLWSVQVAMIGTHDLLPWSVRVLPWIDEKDIADIIVWHLRHDPAALDKADVNIFYDMVRATPAEPRGRDHWACVAADLKGVPFLLFGHEPEEIRDKRIARLLRAIREKERGELFYYEDFVDDIEYDPAGRILRVKAKFKCDTHRDEFTRLALKWLRTRPSALSSAEDEEEKIFGPRPEELDSSWRGCDIWASLLAQMMDLPYEILDEESRVVRDRRIETLLRTIDDPYLGIKSGDSSLTKKAGDSTENGTSP